MYHLAQVFPRLEQVRLPVTRDQAALLLAAANFVFLSIDIYVAHNVSRSIQTNEWIPIVFGPIAGAALLLAGLVALRRRPLAAVIANGVFLASAVVGFLGAWFHLQRAGLPAGPIGERLSTRLLVWGPPFLGPLMFVVIAVWGVSAAWMEDPADSGSLRFFGKARVTLPLPKTKVYFLVAGSAAMVATTSAVFDHARTGWVNANLWIPTAIGVFAAVVALALAAIPQPRRADVVVYFLAMVLLLSAGVVGGWLHFADNLTSRGTIVAERFIRGAPIMAPLLFTNVGLFGLIALMDPREGRERISGAPAADPVAAS